MSIRSGILLVLAEGEAYGLQLHGELEERTDRRINVGQIYSTLDRLQAAGLVQASGTTDDGLPLYDVTEEGRRTAAEWLADAEVDSPSAWSEFTFKLLLATSLGAATPALLAAHRAAWSRSAHDGEASAAAPATRARRLLAEAALAWLDELGAAPGGLRALAVPLRNERPRRGRRPAPAQQ
ncbi:PadR family transcriptional regulator [Herbiconiux sp. 11R-BC]|uniref:PadR family transcriptional regulator n=1 Tax=Herbiconiux sp. 11R-BC TaxID=3111637 RepID=UPI003BFE9963